MMQESENKPFRTEDEKIQSRISDGRYQTLFQQVNAATFLLTLDGKILEANIKSCDLLGYAWDELIQLYLQDILPASTDWSQLIDEISSKGGINFETENIMKDNTHVPVEICASLFKMEGKPVMLALIQDITERKKAEKKLKESEQKYRGLFESTTDGIIVLDARGEISDVNTRAIELLGFKREDMIGSNFLNLGLLTPKSLSIIVIQFEELLSDKVAKSHETEIKDKAGNVLNIELSSFFLLKKDNEVDNFVVILRDLSDRKQAEIKLAREHELLQTLMDNMPDSIYFKDEKNRFIMVNKAKAVRSNVAPEEMMGKTDFDFLPEEEAKRAFEDDKEIMTSGKFIINKIEKLTGIDGSERWVSVTKVPRFDEEGNIIGTIGISRDVTEWKKLEETFRRIQEQK
jgi:PAS domain S-box-containing protein